MALEAVSTNFNKVLAKIVGSANEREVKRLRVLAERVNALEPDTVRLTDDELSATASTYRARLAEMLERDPATLPRTRVRRGGDLDRALDEILPEVFARVREASRRTLGMRHFDVQLIGGAALHRGWIAEMGTGEGKTLAATLAASLNAIAGRGVHVVTVNDYLARRDAEWMGRIYRALGLSVGVLQHDLADAERQAAYAADITYGTNSEFGFDYLRDNMKFALGSLVQRTTSGVHDPENTLAPSALGLAHHFAIVDEVDSILIDEARTPLIISGASEDSTERYTVANDVIPRLRAGVDFEVDEKQHSANLTEAGIERLETLLSAGNLFDPENADLLHCISQALKAHTLYRRDKEYVVRDGQVIIVDEFTGRPMEGRRWSDGLHQAVETKEGVKVESETQTLATITLQNYFRMYAKLSGMTGTAETEAAEFHKIYDLDVVAIPPNRPMVRKDLADLIYRTLDEKWEAIVEEICEIHETGRPVLVGTVSVENSERISSALAKRRIQHNVLNAKHHEREAEIVAQAGRLGAITIATNMAGRGTDILLGGNAEALAREALKQRELDPETIAETDPVWIEALDEARRTTKHERDRVVALGGLAIIGTERHESRRIDNQLRGRAGRQGDAGSSRFFLSLEDDLMRIFGGDRMKGLMTRFGMSDGVPIESRMVTKRIEGAQKSVENRNFDTRKRTVDYDDVMNRQREAIYGMRRRLVEGDDHRERVLSMALDVANDLIVHHLGEPDADPDTWAWPRLARDLKDQFSVDLGAIANEHGAITPSASSYDDVAHAVRAAVIDRYEHQESTIGVDAVRWLERALWLQVIDQQWKDHLLAIDHLRQGIGLVTMAQKDPLVEFKHSGYRLFTAMTDRIETETLKLLFHAQVQTPATPPEQASSLDIERALERRLLKRRQRQAVAAASASDTASHTVRRDTARIRRNGPCPCGSGKKSKKCCGRQPLVHSSGSAGSQPVAPR